MVKKGKSTLTPRLRFPEFRKAEGWELSTIGNLISLEYGESLPEHSRRSGPIPVMGSNGIIGYHDEELIKGPAIVIGRKGSVGRVNWVESNCFPIDTTFYVRNKEPSTNLIQFLHPLLRNSKLEHRRDPGAVPGLNRNEVHSLAVAIPKASEQQKIADCLTSLDACIAAQGRKVESLKALKRGLMQALFPRKGETIPRLRFPEFRDAHAWSRLRVGDVAAVKASGDLDSTVFSVARSGSFIHPVYSNGVERDGLYGYYSRPEYPKGSVTITARGTLGIAFYRDCDFMGIGRLVVVRDLIKVNPYFLMVCWNHLAEIPHEVTSIPQLTAIAVRTIILPIPGLDEQEKIADCLSTLDARIAAEAGKLGALKNHKNGLMQQLFPSPEDVEG